MAEKLDEKIVEQDEVIEDGEDSKGTPGPIPYQRFAETNTKLREAQAQLEAAKKLADEREAELNRQKEEELKANAKWEELAAQYKAELDKNSPIVEALTGERDKAVEILKANVAKQLETVPGHFRSLVSRLDVLDQVAWLNENSDKLVKKGTSGIPETPDPSGASKLTEEERRKRSTSTF